MSRCLNNFVKLSLSLGRMLSNAPYYVAAFIMPSILLFDLYNRNHVNNHIVFMHVLVLAGGLAVVGLSIFIVLKYITRSIESALLLSVLFWLCFWLFESLLAVIVRYFTIMTNAGLMVLLVAVFATAVMCIRRYNPPFTNIRPTFNILAISLIGMFIFNLIPGASHELLIHRARAIIDEGIKPFYIKQSFLIDTTLPNPDIYWIHVDGMMSLETVEWFWNEPQAGLREEIVRRGFVIYEGALLNAGFTDAALPALLSPAFYDSFWGARLAEVETELRMVRAETLNNDLAQVGLTYAEGIIPYYELFSAFIARGYDFEIIGDLGGRLPSSFEHLLDNNNYVRVRGNHLSYGTGDLLELLTLTTPLNLTSLAECEVIESRQQEHEPLARFIWRSLYYTHMSSVWRWDITLTEYDYTAIHVYPQAYGYMAERMLYFVDITLEENPNAVIVLMSDHGFNLETTQQYLLDQGYPLEKVLELIHSVFAAVRIPTQYGGLDEPISPLNVSRELVNRFVGENYSMLQ